MERNHLIAMVLAVAIVFAAFTVMGIESNDADTQDSITYHASVSNNDTTIIGFITNEITFYNIDPTITPVWKYQNANGSYTTFTPGNEVKLTDFKFILTDEKSSDTTDRGKYTVSITGLSDRSAIDTLALQYDITTNKGTTQELTSSFAINIEISLNDANNLPESISYNRGGIQLTVGQIFSYEPTLDAGKNASDYKWYAIDLPDGISLTGSGTLSGSPTKAAGVVESKIVVENSRGQSKAFTVTFAILNNHLLTFYLYDGKFTEDTTDVKWVSSPTQHITQQKGVVTLLIPTLNPNSPPTVTIVDGKGESGRSVLADHDTVTNGSTTYLCYKIPTDGTGTYRISIQKDSTEASFDLYVMPNISAIKSAIIVGSSGSS